MFKRRFGEVDHMFKCSLVSKNQKGFFLQKEAFPKKVDHMFKRGRSYV